jgi:hypothetical protein
LCVANIHANAHCDFNTDRDCARIAHSHCYSYGTTESYTNSDSHEHAECYGDSYPYSYCAADAHCPAASDTEVTSYPGAAPIAVRTNVTLL